MAWHDSLAPAGERCNRHPMRLLLAHYDKFKTISRTSVCRVFARLCIPWPQLLFVLSFCN